MEELAALLAELLEDELFAESVLSISADLELLTSLAFDEALAGAVDAIVDSYEAFKAWSIATLPSIEGILNGIVGLQMIYQMVVDHRAKVRSSGKTVDIEVALEDIEGTLVANYGEMRETAKKLLRCPGLTPSTRDSLVRTASTSSAAYWEAAQFPIRDALLKIPMYAP